MNDRYWDEVPEATPPQNPYAATATAGMNFPGMAGMSTSDEAVRNQYLSHEASVQGMGALYLLGGIFLTIGGAIAMIVGLTRIGQELPEEVAFMLGIAIVYLVMGIFQSWVGIGLRKLNPPARIGGIMLSCLGLLAIPIGTLISAYFLYLLGSGKGQFVFSPEYARVRAATPHIRYKTSIVTWVVLILFILLIISLFFVALRS